jgi:hypothetical protein
MLLAAVHRRALAPGAELKYFDGPFERTGDVAFQSLPEEITEFNKALKVIVCSHDDE